MTVSAEFAGKTAVVTGAGGTLGRAVCRELIEVGATVLAVDHDESALDATVGELGDRGNGLVADVTDEKAVVEYAERARELGGGAIDMFVNNAGIEGRVAEVVDLTVEDLRPVFEVNVIGAFFGLKHVLPKLRAGGAVVNTASTAALAGSAGVAAYVMSKHAVLGLSRTAAIESAQRGIRVTTLCPGPIEGPMMRSLDKQRDTLLGPRHAGERTYGSAAEVARAVLFLLGPGAAMANGRELVLDGALRPADNERT